MLKRRSIYRCSVCGNIVEVLQVGGGTLTCCGQPMDYLSESVADSTTEKHVPFISKTDQGYLVKVGENQEHPMLDAHYIVWIELNTDRSTYRKYLQPGEKPEALFQPGPGEQVVEAREYCNIHGLWKK